MREVRWKYQRAMNAARRVLAERARHDPLSIADERRKVVAANLRSLYEPAASARVDSCDGLQSMCAAANPDRVVVPAMLLHPQAFVPRSVQLQSALCWASHCCF